MAAAEMTMMTAALPLEAAALLLEAVVLLLEAAVLLLEAAALLPSRWRFKRICSWMMTWTFQTTLNKNLGGLLPPSLWTFDLTLQPIVACGWK